VRTIVAAVNRNGTMSTHEEASEPIILDESEDQGPSPAEDVAMAEAANDDEATIAITTDAAVENFDDIDGDTAVRPRARTRPIRGAISPPSAPGSCPSGVPPAPRAISSVRLTRDPSPPLPQSEKSDDEDEGEVEEEIIEEEGHAGTDEDEDEDEDEDVDVEDVLAELTLAAQKRLVEHAQKCVRQPLPR